MRYESPEIIKTRRERKRQMKLSTNTLRCVVVSLYLTVTVYGVDGAPQKFHPSPPREARRKLKGRGKGTSRSERSEYPSAAPSAIGDRRFLLCLPDECGRDVEAANGTSCVIRDRDAYKLSDTTVDDIEAPLYSIFASLGQAIIEPNLASFEDIAVLLEENSQVLSMASIFLSKSLPKDSEFYETQEYILDDEDKVFREFELLSLQAERDLEIVRPYLNDGIVDGVRNHLQVLKTAFGNFLDSRVLEDKAAKEDFTIKFRKVCNDNDFTPEHMFSFIYGYACGVKGNTRDCEDFDYGECAFGAKRTISTVLFNSDRKELQAFRAWISNTLVQLMYFYSVCLPANLDTCTEEENAVAANTVGKMKSAFAEVCDNLEQSQLCSEKTLTSFPLCVIDDRGYPIPRDSVEYATGTVVYSNIALTTSNTEITDELDAAAEVLDAIGGVAELAGPKGEAVGAVFGAIGGVLRIVSIFQGNDQTDPTQALIINGFKEMNKRFDMLESQIGEGFDQVREEAQNVVLDSLMNRLGRIKYAFADFINSRDLTTSDPALRAVKNQYTEDFRSACNDGDFRPEDIIRILYGYACGNDFGNRCKKTGGADVGECKYGRKQRNYLLDIFRDTSLSNDVTSQGSLREFRSFTTWLEGAMVEALFFLTVCLPSDPNACLSDKDPTFNNKLEDAIDAVEEVFANIETVERTCTCGCKMITITHLTTPSDGLAQTETEVKFDVRSSGGNTQLATFRGPQGVSRGFVSLPDETKVSLPHTVVLRGLTQLDTLEFTVFEEGGLDCSGSTFGSLVCSGYVVDTSVGSIGPGDWYRNACTNYPESFKVTGVACAFTFHFTVQSDDTCYGVCPDDLPDKCPYGYCDSAFKCQSQKEVNEACDDDVQCYSGMCTESKCTDPVVDGEPCLTDSNCISQRCEELGANGETLCCDRLCISCDTDSDCGPCGICSAIGEIKKCDYKCSDLCTSQCEDLADNSTGACARGGEYCNLPFEPSQMPSSSPSMTI